MLFVSSEIIRFAETGDILAWNIVASLWIIAIRITGGKAAGVRLQVPKNGPEVRPATDRMREAVFSSIGPAVSRRPTRQKLDSEI